MPNSPIIALNNEDTRVELAPERGGCITLYRTQTSSTLFDWLVPANPSHPSSFPMVPFCSRIENGRFEFQERVIELPANNSPEPHAIHGHGFQQPWQLKASSANEVVVEYSHSPGHWPWSYSARQTFTLHGPRLELEMTVFNHSREPMPVGLGIHPYFPRTPLTRVSAKVDRMLEMNAQVLPVGVVAVPPFLDLAKGLAVSTVALDHAFTGWDGEARIEWPESETSISISSSNASSTLVVYAPAEHPFVCVEPASNAPNSFNTAELPDYLQVVHVLAGGDERTERWVLEPSF